MTTANRRELLPNRMRELHNPKEKIQCLTQIQTLKEKHPPQHRVPYLNRSPASADNSYVHLFWDICPDSPNKNRDTRHRRSVCQGQSHRTNHRQQSLPTSDNADASDITRDGNQHFFYQVIILCICAAEVYRCYAPIKKVVPPFSQHHHTGQDAISAGAQHIHPPNWKHCTVGSLPARDEWGALGSNVPGPRCTPGSPHSRR